MLVKLELVHWVNVSQRAYRNSTLRSENTWNAFPRSEGSTLPALKELIILWGPSHKWLTGKYDRIKQVLVWGIRTVYRGPTEGQLTLLGRIEQHLRRMWYWNTKGENKGKDILDWAMNILKWESASHISIIPVTQDKERFGGKQKLKRSLGVRAGRVEPSPWRVWNFFWKEWGANKSIWDREWYEVGYSESLYNVRKKTLGTWNCLE